MRRVLVPLLLAACGDNVDVETPTIEPVAAVCNEAELPQLLAKLPHVSSVKPESCGAGVQDATCFSITITQPIQHAAPDKTFDQFLLLMHRGCDRPTVVADWGYESFGYFDDELAVLFGANALWIEHRYQGESIPAIADWDWKALTIENGANDMHRVIESFKQLYGASWVSTGASKGGVTATYHAYFFPKDLDGVIPYVAPASRARIDLAYQTYLDNVLTSPCAQGIRDAQVAALTSRRTMMIAKLNELGADGYEDAYLDAITTSFDWGFWQYYGESFCDRVPPANASDEAFWTFYAQFSGLLGPGNDQMSNGALSYEWLTEQGFALQVGKHVASLLQSEWALMTMEDGFRAEFPDVELPGYDGSVTAATRHFVERYAENMLLIYGQYDPWSGGAMAEPQRPTSARYFVPKATHGAQLGALAEPQRTEALAIGERLFGVAPIMAEMPRAIAAGKKRDELMAGAMRRSLMRLP